ncbi:NfeD family protein [Paenibacillus sp. CC-CFT747]|nr:NfeD family protein [Paenibacillus sp. CC-CFT747]
MVEIYWGCLVLGVLFALVTVLLGDLVSQALDGMLDFLSADYLKPVTVAGGITSFGGAGILLEHYSGLGSAINLLLALVCAFLLAVAVHYLYVRPMRNSETSSGYTEQSLCGRIGEVLVPIPGTGYGEVLLKIGAANTNRTAGSFDKEDIQAGARVVVVQVRDGAVYVSRFENNL